MRVTNRHHGVRGGRSPIEERSQHVPSRDQRGTHVFGVDHAPCLLQQDVDLLRSVGVQCGQFDQDQHVEEESLDRPVDDCQLGLLEGIERCSRVIGKEQGPVGQVPGWNRIRSRLDEELDRLASVSLGGEDELAVSVVESLDGPELGVPDLALGREADQLVTAEVDEGHHFPAGPRIRDRSPEPEPRRVPRASPRVAHFERRERSPNGLDGPEWARRGDAGPTSPAEHTARRPPDGPPSSGTAGASRDAQPSAQVWQPCRITPTLRDSIDRRRRSGTGFPRASGAEIQRDVRSAPR